MNSKPSRVSRRAKTTMALGVSTPLHSVTRLSGPMPDPWLCAPASRRVCLFREGVFVWSDVLQCSYPPGTSGKAMQATDLWTIRQASLLSRGHPVNLGSASLLAVSLRTSRGVPPGVCTTTSHGRLAFERPRLRLTLAAAASRRTSFRRPPCSTPRSCPHGLRRCLSFGRDRCPSRAFWSFGTAKRATCA
jgi:hypothetical protein